MIFFPYPLSFQFLPLPFSLLLSSFPSSFLLSSSPLSPLLPSLLSPSSASFPSFSPSSSSSVASLSFSPASPLLFIILPLLYFYSPLFPWKFLSSICFLYVFHPLLPPFLQTFVLFFSPLSHFSLHLFSPFSYLLFSLPFLLICPIHCLFLPLPSFLLLPLSFDTSPTRKIHLFHFLPVKAQTIPNNPLFTSTTFYQKLFSPLPTISTISPTHFSHTNNQLFPQFPTKFCFPPKTLPTLLLFAHKTVLNAPIILFPLLQLTPHKSQTIHKTDNIQDSRGHTANPSIISVIVQNSSPLSSALHSKMASSSYINT